MGKTSHLRQVYFLMLHAKNYKNRLMFHVAIY